MTQVISKKPRKLPPLAQNDLKRLVMKQLIEMPLNICTVLLMITNLKLKHNLSSPLRKKGFAGDSQRRRKHD